jgi:hypothetical protein
MEKKTIYIVKYSTEQYSDYREHTHSAYEDEKQADIIKLDVYINILTAINRHEKGEIQFSTDLGDKYVECWDQFMIGFNNVWVEELNYYTKKQS